MSSCCTTIFLPCSLLSLTLLNGCGGGKAESTEVQKPAPPVSVAEARRRPVPLELRAIGNVEAYSAVEVKSQVAGQIVQVLFTEGDEVRQGQVLFKIDPRLYEQALRESEAQVAAQKAALGQAEAAAESATAQARNARSQSQRYAGLTAKGIISREQNEQFETQAVAAEKAATASQANIASARAAVQGAEARVADARLQLSYTTITAPISGRTGNLTFKAGNLVGANAVTPLVVINQITPAYVTFSVPEQSLADLRRHSDSGKLLVKAGPKNDPGQPAEGALDFLDNRVDPQTGTILLKATFQNKDRRLWPGQFVNVAVQLSVPTEIVVPTGAVKTAQSGSYVFVVKPDQTAEQRTVEITRSWEDLTVISKGVQDGERVIVEGQLRVRPGEKVRVTRTGAEQVSQAMPRELP